MSDEMEGFENGEHDSQKYNENQNLAHRIPEVKSIVKYNWCFGTLKVYKEYIEQFNQR